MNKLIIISGPTAVGKTGISIKLAKEIGGEIISADSMQIYKNMDIGSAKVSEDEMDGIPHHLLGIIEPKERFSVADFKERAEEAIKGIYSRGKIPIIVGGTGLYINSLIYNYDFADANKDEDYRSYLQGIADEKGKEYLHEMLKEVDTDSYLRLSINDLKRVIRALEVVKVTGKTISELYKNENPYDVNYNLSYFVLTMNRETLYSRINERVDIMMENGLLEEVVKLKNQGYTGDMQAMKGIGYKEILEYLNGDITFDEAVEKIKKGSRNYAKRQLTWFRKDKRVNWVDKDCFLSEEESLKYILSKV